MDVIKFYNDLMSSYDLDVRSYELELESIINSNDIFYKDKIEKFKEVVNKITILNLSRQIALGYFDLTEKKEENDTE